MKQTETKFLKMCLSGLNNTYKNVLLFLFLTSSLVLNSQVKIYGTASSYAGDILKAYQFTDYIVNYTEVIDTAKVQSNGYFEFSFDASVTRKVYIELNHLNTFLYVEPNKHYNIRIPTKVELTNIQLTDPYFKKEFVSAYVVSDNKYELNRLINIFNGFISRNLKYLLAFYDDASVLEELDTLKKITDTFAIAANNQYFNLYKEYSMGVLRYVVLKDDKKIYIGSFFVNKPIMYHLSPYMDLFNYIFEDYFSSSNPLVYIPKIYQGMYMNNFIQIKNSLVNDSILPLDDELAQLVTIKALYDKFFRVEKAEEDVIFTMQSVPDNDVENYIYVASQNIFDAITKTRKSFPAYKFSLPNKKNKLKELNDFQGKFVYLSFIHPASGRGQKHLPMLQAYNDARIKDLEIITVFVGDSISEMIKFLDDNSDYKWTFLFTTQDDIVVQNYAVKYYPSYYLINPEGNLSLDYTPTPEEKFEQTYNTVYREWQQQNRNNSGIR